MSPTGVPTHTNAGLTASADHLLQMEVTTRISTQGTALDLVSLALSLAVLVEVVEFPIFLDVVDEFYDGYRGASDDRCPSDDGSGGDRSIERIVRHHVAGIDKDVRSYVGSRRDEGIVAGDSQSLGSKEFSAGNKWDEEWEGHGRAWDSCRKRERNE